MAHQFKKMSQIFNDAIQNEIITYQHPSGATLVWFKNNDEHKTFGIGFKTLPDSSNGVAHILEHSVLNGSRKYRVKEPFMALAKTSLNTFLNAMTYPDMTIYPVSTLNLQDFYNLMNVYMDAVFFPRCLEKPEIFYQEGWHYHLTDKADDLTVSGVVYNEMKGAYGNIDRLIYQQVMHTIFESGLYGVDSGGDPEVILDLTYEQFIQFYQKYYQPSNALLYLYGDLDIEPILDLLDNEYLAVFSPATPQHLKITCESSLKGHVVKEFSYQSNQTDKGILTLTYPLENQDTAYKRVFTTVLTNVLFDSDSAVVKMKLLEKELGDDVLSIGSSTLNNAIGIGIKNCKLDRVDEFVTCVEEALREVVENGLNRDLVLGVINQYEISMRIAGGTRKGLLYFIQAMAAFRYNEDFLANIDINDVFAQIYQDLDNGVFEQYILKNFSQAENRLLGIHRPDILKNLKQQEQLALKLANVKASLSEAQLDEIIELNQRLNQYQNEPDSVKAKQTMPTLPLKDINTPITSYATECEVLAQTTYYYHPASTNGLNYVQFSFKVDVQDELDLKKLSLFMLLLGSMSTSKHHYADLNDQLLLHGLGVKAVAVVTPVYRENDYVLNLNVSTATLASQFENGLADIYEIIMDTDFSDLKRMREIILEEIVEFETSLEMKGHVFAMSRVKAMVSQASAISQRISGLDFYDYLVSIVDHLDAQLVSELEAFKQYFGQHNCIVSLTSDHVENYKSSLQKWVEQLPTKAKQADHLLLPLVKKREAVIIPATVNYVSIGSNFTEKMPFNGSLLVLSNILSNEFLYSKIRAQNGAYGAGLVSGFYGNMVTYSYRDPKIVETIATMKQCDQALAQLSLSESELEAFVIGSLSNFLMPLSPFELNDHYLNRVHSKINQQMMEQWYEQAKQTSLEQLKRFELLLTEMLDEACLCVAGNEAMIESLKDSFTHVRKLKLAVLK